MFLFLSTLWEKPTVGWKLREKLNVTLSLWCQTQLKSAGTTDESTLLFLQLLASLTVNENILFLNFHFYPCSVDLYTELTCMFLLLTCTCCILNVWLYKCWMVVLLLLYTKLPFGDNKDHLELWTWITLLMHKWVCTSEYTKVSWVGSPSLWTRTVFSSHCY